MRAVDRQEGSKSNMLVLTCRLGWLVVPCGGGQGGCGRFVGR